MAGRVFSGAAFLFLVLSPSLVAHRHTEHRANHRKRHRNWIASPPSNQGFALTGIGSTDVSLDSKENVTTSHPAVLQLVQPGATGPQGLGATVTVYTIPGSGGISGGGYLVILNTSQHAELDISCNYGFAGDNQAYWFADLRSNHQSDR